MSAKLGYVLDNIRKFSVKLLQGPLSLTWQELGYSVFKTFASTPVWDFRDSRLSEKGAEIVTLCKDKNEAVWQRPKKVAIVYISS